MNFVTACTTALVRWCISRTHVSDAQGAVSVGRDTSGPTFREALKEQLGLKLESQKSTMEVFVMDHVDHPTEN